jgi:hypothetical protein
MEMQSLPKGPTETVAEFKAKSPCETSISPDVMQQILKSHHYLLFEWHLNFLKV